MRLGTINLLVVLTLVITSSTHAESDATINPDNFTATEAQIINDPAFQSFLNAVKYVKARHLKGKLFSNKQLLAGAIRGVVAELDDKYSEFIPAEDVPSYYASREGIFQGFGFNYKVTGEYPKVMFVDEGEPAETAGLKPEDIIYSYDGVSLKSLPKKKLSAIMTPRSSHTHALLMVGRGNPPVIVRVEMTSQEIEYSAVTSKIVTCPAGYNIAAVLVNEFRENAVRQFDDAMADALRANCKGIILDLRDCHGGSAEASRDMLSYFVGDDALIVTQEDGNGKRVESRTKLSKYRHKFNTSRPIGWEKIRKLPIFCLVDSGSASASEVTVLALRDLRNAPIVGEKTFGKGIGQSFMKLGVLGDLKLTAYRWRSPRGTCIHLIGIKPDYEIKDPAEQMKKALSLFK